jgi:4a-hydroxytetrahydrobiopterin dehydratase
VFARRSAHGWRRLATHEDADALRLCRAKVFARFAAVGSWIREHPTGDDMAELMNDDEIASRLRRSSWEREEDEIVREWRFENFNEAIAFVNRVAEKAEEANHHPDIFIHGWNKVKLSLTNHSAGGLTEMDFSMAEDLDQL